MKRVAIFGGSFDPPHKGHIEVILRLSNCFDRVIVSPGFVTPFKQGAKTASASDRLNLLKIALAEAGLISFESEKSIPNPELINIKKTKIKQNVEISTYEIDKGEVSYSADVVRHYQTDNHRIYFVVGSESAGLLHKWHESEYLKSNVVFYIVPRQNYPVNPSKGFTCDIAPFEIEDFSSSLFKAAHSLNRSQDIVGKGVHDYILKHGLYCDYKHFADGLRIFGLGEKRITHIYGAVKAGITLAKSHDESVDKTITALLLHDIGKNVTDEILKRYNIKTPDMLEVPKECRHAIIGEQIARQYFGIEDKDILNAVRYHTTARPNMSRLEKITALADYVEEGRQFEDRDEIYKIAMTDLNKAMVDMLQSIIDYLKTSGKEIFGISLKALSFYKDLVYTK